MIEPRRATLPIVLELPWEIAELVVQYGPAFLRDLERAVGQRQEVVTRDAASKITTAAACEAQILEWRKLAGECLAEIQRRSNGPGQKRVIIKQLAAERGVSPQLLMTIIKIHGKSLSEVST